LKRGPVAVVDEEEKDADFRCLGKIKLHDKTTKIDVKLLTYMQ